MEGKCLPAILWLLCIVCFVHHFTILSRPQCFLKILRTTPEQIVVEQSGVTEKSDESKSDESLRTVQNGSPPRESASAADDSVVSSNNVAASPATETSTNSASPAKSLPRRGSVFDNKLQNVLLEEPGVWRAWVGAEQNSLAGGGTSGPQRGALNDIPEAKFPPCKWVLQTPTNMDTGKERPYEHCVANEFDMVSNILGWRKKGFMDCDLLPGLWKEARGSAPKSDTSSAVESTVLPIYMDIGANLGACAVHLLISAPDAYAFLFEPHPINFFRLTSTLAKLPEDVRKRVIAFPLGLSSKAGIAPIFSQKGNMGNSVVGKMTFDGVSEEKIDDSVSHFSVVLRDLAMLFEGVGGNEVSAVNEQVSSSSNQNSDFVLRLMKVDMQGFECELLKTFPKLLASRLVSGKMEVSRRQLPAQGCSVETYFTLLEKAGLKIVKKLVDLSSIGGSNGAEAGEVEAEGNKGQGEDGKTEENANTGTDDDMSDYDIIVTGIETGRTASVEDAVVTRR